MLWPLPYRVWDLEWLIGLVWRKSEKHKTPAVQLSQNIFKTLTWKVKQMLFKKPFCATKQRMMEKKLKFLRDILGLRDYCKHVNMQTWGGGGNCN